MPVSNIPSPSPKNPLPGALIEAVENDDITVVRRLLQQNTDVNERDPKGNTALNLAANRGYIEIARLLIDKGANLDSRNMQGNTPLMSAVSSYNFNRDSVVRLLLSKGASYDIKNNNGETAMSLAVKLQRPPLVAQLKEAEATRKRLAAEYAKAAEDKRLAEVAERQKRLRDLGKIKPKPGPTPPQ